MKRFILTIALLIAARSIYAAPVSLTDLLTRFKEANYALIYSTSLVQESAIVEWDGEVSLKSLEQSLRTLGLSLHRIERNLWTIERAPPAEAVPAEDHAAARIPAVRIDNIVVTASRYEVQGMDGASRHQIDEGSLNETPSFAGDSLRIIHRLPGAATLGISSKPNVRGGSSDELLVLFDGVELIEPFHLRDFQSMFSSFNPQTIQNIEYFTGGFPAQYGNKLSGVLDIATQDTFTSSGGELGLSAFSTSALLFTEKGQNRWMFSARRGNLDNLLNVVNPRLGHPKYHDLYARYTRDFERGTLKLSAFRFSDDIVFTSDEASASSKVDNQYVWMEWETNLSPRVYSRTFFSVGDIDSTRLGDTFAEDRSVGSLIDKQTLNVTSIKHLQEFKVNNRLRLEYGFTYRDLEMEYDTSIIVERSIVAEVLALPVFVDESFKAKFGGHSSSAFLTTKYQFSRALTVQMGLRYDRQNYSKAGSQISPRVAMVYELGQDWRLRFSYGRFYQPQAIYELETADLESEFSRPQKSDHWIIAADWQAGPSLRLKAEIFYKRIDDLKPRFENLFDPYNFTPELEPDRIVIRADKAYTRGIELGLVGTYGPYDWNLNYSFSQVRDHEAGRWIDRRWDQTHSLNALLNWKPGQWIISLAGAWHTGWTLTQLPTTIPADGSFEVPAYRSNSRLKNFATLDAKISYELGLGNTSLSFFLEITNLVNRANKGGIDYEIILEDGFYELEEIDLEPVFPLVTNLGVIWRF